MVKIMKMASSKREREKDEVGMGIFKTIFKD
jgi:hypothetical protein